MWKGNTAVRVDDNRCMERDIDAAMLKSISAVMCVLRNIAENII